MAGGGGSTQVTVPGPTPEETALQAEQLKLLRQQQDTITAQLKQQELLSPLLFEQLGLRPVYSGGDTQTVTTPGTPGSGVNPAALAAAQDAVNQARANYEGSDLAPRRKAHLQTALQEAENNLAAVQAQATAPTDATTSTVTNPRTLTGFEKLPKTPEELQIAEAQKRFLDLTLGELETRNAALPTTREIEQLTQQRTLAALKGELPADPALLQSLTESESQLHSVLRANLGPGYETSEPGRKALADFEQRKQVILAGARKDDLTLGEQLSGAREAASFARTQGALPITELTANLSRSKLADIFNVASAPGNIGRGFGEVAAGFSGPLSTLATNRNAQLQATMFNAQQAGKASPLWGAVGTLGGMALGTPFGGGGSLMGRGLASIFG